MSKFWRFGLAILLCSIYFGMAPVGYLAFTVLYYLPSRDRTARARKLQAIMRRAFTLMHDTLRVCGLMNFNPRHVQGQLPDGPAVLVANHPTLVDVTSTLAAFPDVTTVVKPNLFKRFWFRGLLTDARFFCGATGASGLGALIEDAAERIGEGFRVLIFPEGTRSPEFGLHAFSRTAFEVSCRTGAPIVPIVVTCTPVWLSKEHPILDFPKGAAQFNLQVLAPIDPADHGSSSRRLRDVVERVFRQHLGVDAAIAPPATDRDTSRL